MPHEHQQTCWRIRRATREDCPLLVKLAYSAGQGHLERSIYDLFFPGPPGPTPERLSEMERLWSSQARSFLHHDFHLVVESEGMVRATISYFSRNDRRSRRLVEALREIGWSDDDISELSGRMQPVNRVEPVAPEEALLVENAGVFPEYRGRGLIGALLGRTVETAREGDFNEALMGVVIGNEPARRAYEKVGFRVTAEKRDPEFARLIGSPGMWRMSLQLKRAEHF